MDTILCRKLEMEGDLIYLPLDGKGQAGRWASQRNGFGDGGDADLFIQGPSDGAHKDGWREYGFR